MWDIFLWNGIYKKNGYINNEYESKDKHMPIGFGFYESDISELKENSTLRQENISRILFTGDGERLNRPSFGSRLLKYLFNFEKVIREDIEDEIVRAITTFQPDLEVRNINIQKKENTLKIDIVLFDTTEEQEIVFAETVEVQ